MSAAMLHDPARRLKLLLVAGALAAGAAGLAAMRPAPVPEARATVAAEMVTPAAAGRWVAATSGEEAAVVRATGEDARKINAAMPFAAVPVEAARPFAIGGADTADYRRALLCLTQAVYYEAGYEPLSGRRGVAQVVLNRMRHPAFPKSVCGVVYQGAGGPVCQFSFVCDGSLDRRPASGAWDEARRIAAAALGGAVEASVGQATHYHADYVAPRWAPMLAKVHQVGAHIFYRWPGAWGRTGAFNGRYRGEPADPATLRPVAVAEGPSGEVVSDVAAGPSGPPVSRAANDVGGLLDTSKGWTLSIPTPSESGAASRAIAERQAKAEALSRVEPAAGPALAARGAGQ